MDEPVLAVEDLTVRYGAHLALEGVTFEVGAGSSLAVIGANGSGKSTLLHAVAGILDPSSGAVRTDRSRAALVLQATAVDAGLPISVRDTVRLGRYPTVGLFGRFGAEDHAAVGGAMERMAVADLADRSLHDLSGGQRQRVLMAQGLAQEADLLLLDEPATGLDLGSREIILGVLREVCAAGRAVIMTTHDLSDARLLDDVLLLARRQVAHGPPADVLRPGPLREAFGGAVMALADGGFLMDDPHHGH